MMCEKGNCTNKPKYETLSGVKLCKKCARYERKINKVKIYLIV